MISRFWRVPAYAALAAAGLFLVLAMLRPPQENWRLKKVRIPRGSSYPEIVRILTESGVLRFPAVFRVLVTVTMTGTTLQQGEYAFPSPPSALELWQKISSGDVSKYPVTIPEGSTLYDVARILGDLELADPGAFVAAATSPGLANRLDIPGDTAEGFLFPDTYLLVKDMREEEILSVLVRRFHRQFTTAMQGAAALRGLTLHQVVTIASIIEKETGVEAEKPIVSSVIHRRLKLGMPLQMDPTVIYGLRKFGGNLSRKDLQSPNPYNTYLNRGLPPGPIANPGLSALMAALEPADVPYLYFVSKNDGSHRFSTTLEEHNRAVAEFQRERGAKSAKRAAPAKEIGKENGATPRPPR